MTRVADRAEDGHLGLTIYWASDGEVVRGSLLEDTEGVEAIVVKFLKGDKVGDR